MGIVATITSLFGQLGAWLQRAASPALDNYVHSLEEELIAAGEPANLTAKDMLGLQVSAAMFFPLFWAYVLIKIPAFDFLFDGPQQILFYLAMMAAGFYFPVMNIRERKSRRQHSISLMLPDALDLLTISVEAGLDFMTAMKRVVDKQKAGPLKDETQRFFRQVELGRTRREALREMANRVQLPDLSAVVSALIQADRLGASIGPILRVQSDVARVRRGQRAEKAAQEAPVKLLAPLVLCIFPAVFIMIFAPVVIQMIKDMAQ
jgi:tight adherence protein C